MKGCRKMIIVNLDVIMAKRKISSGELAEKVGITPANLSILKTNKAKAIRFSTLEKICEVLECKPGDILDYKSKQSYTKLILFQPDLRKEQDKKC